MGLRGLGVLALFWIVGVAVLASRIGGTLGVMVGIIFIFPVLFSSIEAAWQASVLMPSAYQKQRHQQAARARADEPEESDEAEEEDEAVAEPVIPEPAPPAPSLDGPPVGQPLQL